MYRFVFSTIVTILLAGSLVGQADAGLLGSFTNRAAWTAAAGGGAPDYFEDFNGVANQTLLVPPLVLGGLTVESNRRPGTLVPNGTSIVTDLDASTRVNGTRNVLHRDGTASFTDESVTYTFDMPIFAFGFDVNPNPSRLGVQINFDTDASGGGSFLLPANDVSEFRGFTFDSPFTSITFSSVVGQNAFGADDVTAFKPVPEASSVATWALMGLTGLGLMWYRRK